MSALLSSEKKKTDVCTTSRKSPVLRTGFFRLAFTLIRAPIAAIAGRFSEIPKRRFVQRLPNVLGTRNWTNS
jgi:hypothetical protein